MWYTRAHDDAIVRLADVGANQHKVIKNDKKRRREGKHIDHLLDCCTQARLLSMMHVCVCIAVDVDENVNEAKVLELHGDILSSSSSDDDLRPHGTALLRVRLGDP
jgi:hypothetical protein